MIESIRFVPQSLQEASALLSEYGDKAEVMAGGTDLLIRMKRGVSFPEIIISLNGIQGLDHIDHDVIRGLRIGALTKLRSIRDSPLVKDRFAVLSEAAGMLGTPTIRNHATLGGNLCNAAPSADTAPALIVLGASVKLAGPKGDRTLPIEEFFTGPGATALNRDELLREIRVPAMRPQCGTAYLKQKRSEAADLAVVGVAVLIETKGDTIVDARIALGAVGPTPFRAKKTEYVLIGKKPDENLLEEAGLAASSESCPIDDIRASADYRRELVALLVKRAVNQAIERISSESA